MEVGGQLQVSAALPRRILLQYRLDTRLGRLQLLWTLWIRENSGPTENQTPAVQPVSRRNTDWAIHTYLEEWIKTHADVETVIVARVKEGIGFRALPCRQVQSLQKIQKSLTDKFVCVATFLESLRLSTADPNTVGLTLPVMERLLRSYSVCGWSEKDEKGTRWDVKKRRSF
jgi:hypothetical protein